jgi:hypothetical protein
MTECTVLNTHIGAYDTLVSKIGMPLSDIFKMKKLEKVAMPGRIYHANTYVLKSFKVLSLHTLLGNSHVHHVVLVVMYHPFSCLWDSQLMSLETEGVDHLTPSKLVWWVQIHVSLWFQHQYCTSEPETMQPQLYRVPLPYDSGDAPVEASVPRAIPTN